MTALTALTELCPPPEEALGIRSGTVEDRLGMPLPRDYKHLADRYGPGSFNDHLSLFHPHGVTEYVNLTGPMPGRIRAQLRKDYDQGTQPDPHDPDTLFACGAMSRAGSAAGADRGSSAACASPLRRREPCGGRPSASSPSAAGRTW
jgi:hypothetical protein